MKNLKKMKFYLTYIIIFLLIVIVNVFATPMNTVRGNSTYGNSMYKTDYDYKIVIQHAPETLEVGQKDTLQAYTSPTNSQNKNKEWSSSNSNIARVTKDGIITGVNPGTVTVTVKAGIKQKSVTVTVVEPKKENYYTYYTYNYKNTKEVDSIRITNKQNRLKVGESINLATIIEPSDATDKTVEWSSKDPSIATVSQHGTVTGIKAGKTQIWVKAGDNKKDYVEIEVYKEQRQNIKKTTSGSSGVKKYKITNAPGIMFISDNIHNRMKLEVNTEQKVKWTSSNPEIISVEKDGEIKTHKVGQATIKAEDKDGNYATVDINVGKLEVQGKVDIKTSKRAFKTILVTVPNTYKTTDKLKYEWNSNTKKMIWMDANPSDNYAKYASLEETWVTNGNVKVGTVKQMLESYALESMNAVYNFNISEDLTNKNITGKIIGNIEYKYEELDQKIVCPEIEYNYNGGNVELTITPNSQIKEYEIKTSVNQKVGNRASWSTKELLIADQNPTKLTYKITDAQVKIKVYDNNNHYKNCYSVPFYYFDSEYLKQQKNAGNYLTNGGTQCPTISEVSRYTMKNAKTIKTNANDQVQYGVKSANIKVTPSKNAQYTFITKESGTTENYIINKTFNKAEKYKLELSTENMLFKQGYIIAMDSNGDIRECKTDTYSPVEFDPEKTEEIDGVTIYYQKGITEKRIKQLSDFIKAMPKEYKVGTTEVLYFTDETYKKNHGPSAGIASGTHIEINSGGEDDYHRNCVVHEMGHNLDSIYPQIAISKGAKYGESIRSQLRSLHDESRQNENKKCEPYKSKSQFNSLDEYWAEFNKCQRYTYLRNYSYKEDYTNDDGTVNGEFWADLLLYTYINEKYPNSSDKFAVSDDMIKARDKYMTEIRDNYDTLNDYRNGLK